MNSKRLFCSLLITTSFLMAEQSEEEAQLMMNQTFVELAKPENLKEFRNMRDNKNLIEDEFLNLNDFEISSTPENLKLSDTNFISLHPELPKTVVFSNARITDLTAYPTGSIMVMMDENNFNTIEIKIANSFKKGAVVVKYLDKAGKRKIANLMIESYNSKRSKKIYLTTILKDYSQMSPLEIVKSYQKINKSNPVDNSTVVINNEVYRFIEDKVNGFVTIGDKKFRIEHNFK